jgi:putative Ca2+/H+ antiporter (TMEM165/GDT1 family)
MDALMAALVAALLIRATDRSAGWVAVAAERSGRTGAVLGGTLIALIVTHVIAATAGFFVGQHITPNPRQLMLGLALLAAASGAVWPGKAKPYEVRRPFIDTLAHLIATGIGGRSEFVIFAIALGGLPVLAGFGGVIGSLVVLGFAAVAGDSIWRTLPHRILGWAIGVLLGMAGTWQALAALRLI